ncbi:MAG: hypothetical protein IJ689_06815 [Alphaproteobacteria bacterium]|nr:hypothetical protein [Alphaproteobacteria bacterium]
MYGFIIMSLCQFADKAILVLLVVFLSVVGLLVQKKLRDECQRKEKENVVDRPSFFDEDAGKLAYAYFPHPMPQTAHSISYFSPYLVKDCVLHYKPRDERGKAYDNVRGIVITPQLTLLREILFQKEFPDDIREIMKHYKGRLPTEAEIRAIYAQKSQICNNLMELGESPLCERRYLFTCGDEKKDKVYNYCLDFATGEVVLADCDSFVAAVLVE